MFRIFNKDVISKELFTVNLSQQEVDVVLEGNLFKDHPELSRKACIVVEQDYPFSYPTFDREKNTIREMTKYEKFKKGIYELHFNEVEYQGDILTLKEGQYIDEHGVLQTAPKIDGTRVEWNWTTHIWEEKATDLEVVMAQYNEYSSMDTPSTLKEMQMQDPTLAEELVNMLIELRGMIYSLQVPQQATTFAQLHIPTPSQNLINFKNKFNLTK